MQHGAQLRQLRSVAFQINNMPKKAHTGQHEEKAKQMILNGPPLLRGVQINDMCWEVCKRRNAASWFTYIAFTPLQALWGTTSELTVQRTVALAPPWRRLTDN